MLTLVDGLTGGAERLARLVTQNLDGDRFRRTLCVSRMPADAAEEEYARAQLEAAGAQLLMLRRRGRGDVAPWGELVRFMRSEHVDILHAHKFGSNIWAVLVGALVGRSPAVIAHEHTWSYQGQPLRRFLDRELISRHCDRFLAVSRLDRERMIEIERIDPARIEVVPVGIAQRHSDDHDVRAELGIAPDAPVLVSVAYLRPQKALEVLVTAARELRNRHRSLRVLIVGDGGERPRLEALVASLGLGDVVSLLGERRDVADILRAADVAVSCSDFEGAPLAVLEYMSAGRPVVATGVGGVPDLVLDGVTGLLVPPRSPAELASSVDQLLTDPIRAREMGIRGRQRQQSHFSIEATVNHLERIYEELLSRRGGTLAGAWSDAGRSTQMSGAATERAGETR